MGFAWQACHKLMYPTLGIAGGASDTDVASKLLDSSFDQFLYVLPGPYSLDGHFQPWSWSRKLRIGETRWVDWPACEVVGVKDADALQRIPGVDWSVKTNTTDHLRRDFVLAEQHKSVIRSVYMHDFRLGRYSA